MTATNLFHIFQSYYPTLSLGNTMQDTKRRKISPETSLSVLDEDSFLTTSSSSKSKIYFNAIDKAHEILEHDRDLAKKVPSCVVVGMQSVGKSAILSRISGIRFPQDSEVCTRVAIELRLRRARCTQDGAIKPMTIKAGNSEGKEVDKNDDIAVEKALKDAQIEVLNGRKFEDKLSVKVEKEDVDLPEVTLIDLPGVFFAKDDGADDLEEQVKNMIKERVHNEMALILHVVPLNQDTDTISTWRTVRDADDKQMRTISVLTKADLALKDGKDILKKRIQKILTDSKSSECFVVHGAAKSTEDEESQLAMVSNYIEELSLGDRIKVGVNELNEFIEDRMLEHIKERIPEMRRLLENELHLCENELQKLGRQPFSSISIALRDSQCMKQHLAEAYASFQPDYRRFTERMTQELFEIDVKPLGIVDAEEAKLQLIKNMLPGLPSQQDHQHHILALEVKKIGEDSRTMINVPYVGKRTELESWLQTFAEPFEKVLKKYIEDVFDAFNHQIFQPSILNGSSEPTKIVTKHLELLIKRNVIVKAKNDAMDYANYLVDSVEGNTYTSNDHYLTCTTREFEKKNDKAFENMNKSYKLNMQPHFHVVCGIRAFFKIRKKTLPDCIQLHFTKALDDLFKETEKEIGDQMMSNTTISMIKESARSIARRKFHLRRENKIKYALEEISVL
jgi:GTP-binding protein EngB required for normal cell division